MVSRRDTVHTQAIATAVVDRDGRCSGHYAAAINDQGAHDDWQVDQACQEQPPCARIAPFKQETQRKPRKPKTGGEGHRCVAKASNAGHGAEE